MASKTEQLFEAAGTIFPRSPHRHAINHPAAVEAAQAARADAALALASLAAYGIAIDRTDPLAVAFRDADDAVIAALAAWRNATDPTLPA